MTPEEAQRAMALAANAVPAVHVTGFSVIFLNSCGMARLSAVEHNAQELPVIGRGAWLMTRDNAVELHKLLGQLIEVTKPQ